MIPAHYLAVIEPLDGVRSMLELGNKNGTGGKGDSYKKHFEARGIRHISVDWNGEDGALALDLREPLGLGVFDMVTNVGTSEHVDRQAPAWSNMIEAAGRFLVCITPAPGDWPGHGLFYPSESFYHSLGFLNGFAIQKLYTAGPEGRRLTYARLERVKPFEAFIMPPHGMSVAPPRKPKR